MGLITDDSDDSCLAPLHQARDCHPACCQGTNSMEVLLLISRLLNQFVSMQQLACTANVAPRPLAPAELHHKTHSRFARTRTYYLYHRVLVAVPENGFSVYFTAQPALPVGRSFSSGHHGGLWPDELAALDLTAAFNGRFRSSPSNRTLDDLPFCAAAVDPGLPQSPIFISKRTGRQVPTLFCEIWCDNCGAPVAIFCVHLPCCALLVCPCRRNDYHEGLFLRLISEGLIGRFAYKVLYVPSCAFVSHALYSI
jgi:hypothetical protein